MKYPGRRLLMISYGFPPTGGPGVQRSVKFAKYLPEFGWRPTVWAVDQVDDLPRDDTLAEDLSADVTVHRYAGAGWASAVRRMLRRRAGGNGAISGVARAVDWRLKAWAARRALPDAAVCWARASFRPLCQLVRRERVQAVYSTYSEASNHLLGLALKRKTGLPWVADFRDLWTDDYRYNEPSPRRRQYHRRLEQEILEAADVVIGVTGRQTEILANHVPHLGHKFVTISNGFDPTDLTGMNQDSSVHSDRPFVLAHVGRFDRWRTHEELFEGLQRFVAGLGADADRFLFRVVGHVPERVRERLVATGVRCEFTGYVDHREALREMQSADALLLSVPDGPNADSVIPGKLFEYLASQRPILVVGPPSGECERIIDSCHAGLAATFDAGAIAEALARLHGAWLEGCPIAGCGDDCLQPYDRRGLTRRLAAVFDRLLEGRDRQSAAAEPQREVCTL